MARKTCNLCYKKRKMYSKLKFGQLWRECCRKCFKEYVKIADHYAFIK